MSELRIHPDVVAGLPPGWKKTDPRLLGWTSSIIVPSNAFAILNGLTWVAVSSTGVVTMQGQPITREHFEALAYLQSLAPTPGAGGEATTPRSWRRRRS